MCKKDRPCSEWGTCSQRCLEVHRKPKCYCIEGYILEPDGFSCKSNGKNFCIFICNKLTTIVL